MAGCFGNTSIDRWLESQVDEYNGDHKRRLTPDDYRAMEEHDLTEDEIREGIYDSETDNF